VLLDIFMPLKDGLETLMELRDEFPNARVIAMSAGWQSRPLGAIGAPPDVLHQADVLGADLTIAKPIEPAALLAAIATALTLRR
jgi:CheY-like chemotaxis protein